MKKFTILTSLLALTACGSGSSVEQMILNNTQLTNLPTSFDNINFSDIKFDASDGQIQFNVKDGNIVSITENPGTPNALVFNRTGITSFNLPNKLYMLGSDDEIVGPIYMAIQQKIYATTGNYDYAQFTNVVDSFVSETELSNEAIKAKLAEFAIAEFQNCQSEPLSDEVIDFINAQFADINDEVLDKWALNSAKVTLNTLGHSVGLKYSDFGYFGVNAFYSENGGEPINEISNSVYAGGFGNKTVTPTENMVFNGKAVAAIVKHNGSGNPDTAMVAKTNDANLAFNGTTEKLTMNFAQGSNPWYNMIATQSVANSSDKNLTIVLNDEVTAHLEDEFKVTNDMLSNKELRTFNVNYYGENETATEATGFVEAHLDGMEVSAAFGGKAE